MNTKNELKLVLSKKAIEALKIGIKQQYIEKTIESNLKEDVIVKGKKFRFEGDFKRIDYEKARALQFIESEFGMILLNKYIEDEIQEMQLEHVFIALKRNNPWTKVIFLNLISAGLGAMIGPTFLMLIQNLIL